MNDPLLIPLPGNDGLARGLAAEMGLEAGAIEGRCFPDGESYLRYGAPVAGRPVVLVATLDRPNTKFLPLAFAAATARELGATSVGLVAPYLGYMRQDHRFKDGEAVTSVHFGRLLSGEVDWLVTVDPHLHRRSSLDEIYSIPTRIVRSAPAVAHWLAANVERPLLIGPDAESEQWVAEVGRLADVPHLVLEKTRHGDRDVEITPPDRTLMEGRTPVLFDDIISTGQTLVRTLEYLRGGVPPVCMAVHAVFADKAYADLHAAGAASIVTTNTIPHATNAIDIVPAIAEALSAADF
ncbi:MAG: phosphoribosylpyrophosphate synthetase [Rhodospirillaceae bacterium]|nr:phosphoribosylpyrophosphate synthetase [Rhodospirillaceae bacterium]